MHGQGGSSVQTSNMWYLEHGTLRVLTIHTPLIAAYWNIIVHAYDEHHAVELTHAPRPLTHKRSWNQRQGTIRI